MDRWTMEELESTDDITFAISILSQRRNGLNPYSPLSMKLSQTISTLETIKKEKDLYLRRICGMDGTGAETEDDTNERDDGSFERADQPFGNETTFQVSFPDSTDSER